MEYIVGETDGLCFTRRAQVQPSGGSCSLVIINNNNENIYYAPCLRVIKPAQMRFTIMVHIIPE